MDKLNPKITKRKAVKDGLGNNVRDYYYDPSSQQIELVTNPPEHVSSSDFKVGSPAHKQKFPDRYKAGYVDWWNRDKKEKINNEPLVKQFRNDDPSTYLSDPEQQKGMLLATIEDAKKPKLKQPKKINPFSGIEIPIPTVNYSLLRDPKEDAREQ